MIKIAYLFHIRLIIIKKKINNNSIIWINNKIKNAIKKKKKLYRDSLTLKNTVSINRYKIYRNKVNAIIRRQKNAAYTIFFVTIIVQICGLKLRN